MIKLWLALSGGEFAVCASLIHKATGNNLICINIDSLMRQNECDGNIENYKSMNLNIYSADASDEFLNALKNITDPEKKRKIIK